MGIDFIRQNFGDGEKVTESSPSDNLTRWIITQSRGFTRKDIEKVSRSVQAYVSIVFISQVQARSSVIGNSTFTVGAEQVFQSMFNARIN